MFEGFEVNAMPQPIIEILKPDGSLCKGADPPDLSPKELLRLYRTMLLNRRVDEQMVRLQRQGRIGFYIGSLGEEAAIIGSAAALAPNEWIMPCYRELGAALYRGFPLFDFFCQLFGNARDPVKGRQMPNHYAIPELRFGSISSPVGTQIPQAVGMAWAAKILNRKEAVLVYFGDGATSQGDFHVGANFAGVYEVPIVLLCRNNQWAISVPFSTQTASDSIAVKASAYGLEGIRVDGNDIFAVHQVTRQAAEKAREGGGATLIEAVTYRLAGHSTSDDPRAYRPDAEVKEWQGKDPLLRFKRYLIHEGHWSEADDQKAELETRKAIQVDLKRAEKVGPPAIDTLFEDVFDQLPWHLQEQLQNCRETEEGAFAEHEV